MSDYEDFELDVQITGDAAGGAEPRATAVACAISVVTLKYCTPVVETITLTTETPNTCACTVSCDCSQNGSKRQTRGHLNMQHKKV